MAILQDTKIKNVKPQEKNFTLSDGEGLHLLVKPNGSKLWEFRYTSPNNAKKRRKLAFGAYPVVSLAEARRKRFEAQVLISDKIDPLDKKADEEKLKESNDINLKQTIEKIVDEFFELKQHNKKLKDITVEKARARLENHFYAYLPQKEKTNIFDITFDMTVEILKKLESASKLETLDRVKKLIIEVFKYTYTENIIKDIDLFAKLEIKTFKKLTKADVKNHPTLTDPDEIGQLLKSINTYSGEVTTKYALLMSIHTAQRQGSIITAKWSDIDFKENLWIIPSERMKMKREHMLPLSKQMMIILERLHEVNGEDEYLFPNIKGNRGHMSNNTVNMALRKMGFTKERIVAHGFRSMFSTICNDNISEHNINYEFIEKALAHQEKDQIREVYNRAKNIKELKKLMQWYSDYLTTLII